MRNFCIACTMLITLFVSPLYAEDKPVILHPTKMGIENQNGGHQRSPIAIPEACLDGYTLTFDASCIGCPLTLVDEEENIVYTTVIDDTGTVELPDTLSGIFELQIVRGSITFVGEIEL